VRKTVVIGAHYDVSVTAEQAEAARLSRSSLRRQQQLKQKLRLLMKMKARAKLQKLSPILYILK
jgi:hypothetical protein